MRARRPAPSPTHSAVAALVVATLAAPLAAQDPAPLPSLAEPGISPDGSEIAFVSGGDVWTVSSQGGAARLLVAHSADESRPLYSPDGRRLAFNSDREGGLDVFVMDLGTGVIRRLTHGSGAERLDGWSRDGAWVYFSSSDEDISGMQDVYRVRVTGGTPMVVAGDDYETEFHAAPSPAGGTIAVSSRGRMAHSQWWRNGHSHIDEAEIWLVTEDQTPEYRKLTDGGKNMWPMWASGADRIYFMSDRSGSENLWSVGADGSGARPLTDFDEGRVLWPSMAVVRPVIAFERDFGVWTHDVASGTTRELDVRLVGSVEGPAPEHLSETEGFSDLALSPDGDKIAFVVRGEVFAAPADGDAPAARVTHTPAAEGELAWSADSGELAYVSWRNGTPQLFAYDFTEEVERQLTSTAGRDERPLYSPDGRWLAYGRDLTELRVIELESGEDRQVATGPSDGPSHVWSPDSRWLAYAGRTDEFNNVMVVPVEGGAPQQVSFLANTFLGSIDWSADGEYLVYGTSQRTEPGKLVRVDLVPRTPTFREDRFWDLFNRTETDGPRPERADDATAPGTSGPVDTPEMVEIVTDGIRRRGNLVDIDFSVGNVVLSPDAEHAVVTGDGALHYVTLEGDFEIERLGPAGQSVQFSPDGEELYMLRSGQVQVLRIGSSGTRTISTTAELDVDFDVEKRAVFEQAWGEMRDGFYDDQYHGADWDAVHDRFAPRVAGAKTRAELNRILNLMMGELNASHLGHRLAGGGDGATPTGKLGLRFDRLEYERDGRFRVTGVIELGPAHVAGDVAVGDYVTAVDGAPLDGSSDLDRILAGTPGEKVTLTVADGADGAGARSVEVQAISLGAERQLVYRGWVEGRRAYVDEISEGRLGYVHIASMSAGALDQLVFDLDQGNHAREGVVIDVRNNNGGFVNVYAIDIFSRQNYFTMENRNGVVAPSRAQLGQRALMAPTVLVTNQHTLSDGEDFTEGYRSLGLGPVVGEPTAGWIIYTWTARLVDGSTIRMPRSKIRDMRGQVMELNPRPVDVDVERPLGESYQGRDTQLERAVDELLTRLGVRATTSSGN